MTTYGQQPPNKRPTLILDRFRLVIGIEHDGRVRVYLGHDTNTAEAKALLDHIYTQVHDYLEEVTQPPEPRLKPSPHYRSVTPQLPTRIDEGD